MCVFPCVCVYNREIHPMKLAKLLLKYCQYDTNAAFYTPPLVILTCTCARGFYCQSIFLSLLSPFQSNKEVRSPRVAAMDLPVVSDGVRNIKSMWEKGNVFSSTISTPSSNKVGNIQSEHTDGHVAHLSFFTMFLSTPALWSLTLKEFSLLFSGCSWNKGGRCRSHQRLAE